jgi:UDP-N-acetylglucosamine acyltransferase
MARVSMDVPPFMIVEGNPAEVRGHNHIAMARRGFTETDIGAMKEAYKRLFRDRGGSLAEKISGLLAKYPGVRSVDILVNAVNAQARGVHGRSLEVQRPDDRRAPRA